MLGQRRWRWPNIEPELVDRFGLLCHNFSSIWKLGMKINGNCKFAWAEHLPNYPVRGSLRRKVSPPSPVKHIENHVTMTTLYKT